MRDFNLYLKQGAVYVPDGKNMICIGTNDDIKDATPEDIVEMIESARQISRYMMIGSGRNRIVH